MPKETRNTRQKVLIEEEMKKMDCFFTADELFDRVRKKDKKMGMATIYRFLNDIGCKDALHCYVCDRKKVYSSEKNNHCHFICSKCGKTSHLDIGSIDSIKKNIKGKICHFQIDVYGICEDCLKQN
ncbi:MAG: transcriptional repressor [archaeon]